MPQPTSNHHIQTRFPRTNLTSNMTCVQSPHALTNSVCLKPNCNGLGRNTIKLKSRVQGRTTLMLCPFIVSPDNSLPPQQITQFLEHGVFLAKPKKTNDWAYCAAVDRINRLSLCMVYSQASDLGLCSSNAKGMGLVTGNFHP